MVLDQMAVRGILPHRYPFLLVDRIVSLEKNKIVGLKNVTANEPFFEGHFPEKPVMPGVLLVEAMAQVGGVLVGKSVDRPETKLLLLGAVDRAKFRRQVEPGDQLLIEVELLNLRSTAAKLKGRVLVDGKLVAEADLMCAVIDRPGLSNGNTPDRSR